MEQPGCFFAGLGFGVEGLGFRVGVEGFGFWIWGLGFGVEGVGLWESSADGVPLALPQKVL